MDHNTVITRIPPSPTGHFHIGTARTALFNYLFAKKHGGTMVFRSEDTDRTRSTTEFETEIMEGLTWLGLDWDNTDSTVVRQSERSAIYRSKLEELIANGGAYLSAEPSKADPTITVEVIRLKNPNIDITFTDIVRGDITFNTTELGDLVIARNINDALYHFTVVVDDELMGVTHVIRGEDHIPNTPRQILIQMALGYNRPTYAHLPLILATDRSKMSKRHGATALIDYKAAGFIPAAIVNYLALLGWNPGTEQEIFTLPELIEQFSVEKIQKGGAVFDIEKFKWFNREHLSRYTTDEFAAYLAPAVPDSLGKLADYSEAQYTKIIPLVRERIHTRAEFIEFAAAGEYDFAFVAPTYETDLLQWKNDTKAADALPRLEQAINLLETADFTSPETVKASLMPLAETVGKGELLWPVRIALSGKKQSPDPFTIAMIIGQGETISRLRSACDKLRG